MRDVRGDVIRRQLNADHAVSVGRVRSICGYLINAETPSETIAQRVDDLFADPIIEHGATNTILLTTDTFSETPSSPSVSNLALPIILAKLQPMDTSPSFQRTGKRKLRRT